MFATLYKEKRKSSRFAEAVKAYYSGCFYDTDFVPRWSENIPTTCLNESATGLCILTKRYLPRGTRLKITAKHWGYHREGTVSWCRTIGVERYKAGLAFKN